MPFLVVKEYQIFWVILKISLKNTFLEGFFVFRFNKSSWHLNCAAFPLLFHVVSAKTEIFTSSWDQLFYSLLISADAQCCQTCVTNFTTSRSSSNLYQRSKQIIILWRQSHLMWSHWLWSYQVLRLRVSTPCQNYFLAKHRKHFLFIPTSTSYLEVLRNKKLPCDVHQWTLLLARTVHNFTQCFTKDCLYYGSPSLTRTPG
jgi:hypothetical protein